LADFENKISSFTKQSLTMVENDSNQTAPEAPAESQFEALQPETIELINKALKEGAVTNQAIKSMVQSKLDKHDIALRRAEKRRLKGKSEAGEDFKPFSGTCAISYQDSRIVWGEALSPHVVLDKCLSSQMPKVFNNPKLNFQTYWLNSLTIVEMSEMFPDIFPLQVKSRPEWMRQHAPQPGHYLLSLSEDEKQANVSKPEWINHCLHLKDPAALAQILITMHKLGRPMPTAYFRTNVEDPHKNQLFVCFREGKVSFFSSARKKAENGGKVGAVLYKNELWIE